MIYDLSFVFIRVLLNVENIFSFKNMELIFAKVSNTIHTKRLY